MTERRISYQGGISDEPLQYTCCDCGCPVYAWGYTALPEPPRCGTCAWIATLPAEDQQPARERLGRPVR